MSNLTYLNNIIDNRYQTYETIKRKYGIVKEIINTSKAIVTLDDKDMSMWQKEYKRRDKERKEAEERGEDPPVYNNDGTRDLTLPNATGETLVVGDSVWVYYWHDLASGYIAIVNRLSKHNSDSGLYVNKLAVLNEAQGNLYAHAKKYNSSYQWDSQAEQEKWLENYESRTMNIDEKNDLKIAQGEYFHGYNVIFVNGTPVLINIGTLNLVNPNLFSQELVCRVNLSLVKRRFQNHSIITETKTITPSRDTTIYLSVTGITTNNSNKRYWFGAVMVQDDVEYGVLQNALYYTSVFPAINNLKLCIGMNASDIYDANETFPYGYISAMIVIYDETNFDYETSASFDLGFQSDAEREYARCVLSMCGYEIIT